VAYGFVLVGGLSRRMGRDKALLPLHGVPMALRQAKKLEALCSSVAFVGKEPGELGALGFPFVKDGTPEQAALHGLVAALGASTEEACLVLAADLPNVSGELLAALLARLEASGAAAVVPWDGKGPQPLCAAWSTRALPALRASAASGDLSLRRALEAAGGVVLSAEETARLPGFVPGAFRNVNTPEDHRAAEEESP
jgi:molybdopterin-guanine dinucleotide biosynthesis protein A